MLRTRVGVALILLIVAITALVLSLPDAIVYNPSSSIPRGFYARVGDAPTRGVYVTVLAREVSPTYAALRDFDDASDRFIKRVAAVGGDRVCADATNLTINGRLAATRRQFDREGRPLPTWTGCHTLADDEFLLLGDTADSFDSRYFGIVHDENVEGVWRRLP